MGSTDLIRVIKDKCTGCKMCVKACPFSAIEIVEKKAVINLEKCTLCAACIDACKPKAIEIVKTITPKHDLSQYKDVWVFCEQKKGAVGALHFWVMEKKINQALLVIAGDNYFGFNLAEFIAAYDGEKPLVAVHDIDDKRAAAQFGVVELKGSRIVEFEEKPAKPKSTLVATAIYIFPPRLFPILAQYCFKEKTDNLGGFISYLVDTDEVNAYVFAEPWLDIGSLRR